MEKSNNTNYISMNFRVTEDERDFINKKYRLSKVKNRSVFLRKLVMQGYILNIDYSAFRDINANIGRIAGTLNQIGKRVNTTNNIYKEDVEEIKKKQEEVWLLLKSIQSKLP